MKNEKFHTILICKSSILKFFCFLLCTFLTIAVLKRLPAPAISKNHFFKIADISFEISIPNTQSSLLNFEFDFLTRSAVKAAGFDFLPSYDIVASNKDSLSTIPNELDASAHTAAEPVVPSITPTDEANIFEKTLSGKYGTISVDNKTDFSPDTDALLNSPISFNANKSEPLVLIVHTHSTESYTPSENYNYIPESNSRTTDKNFNIIRVGNEFEKTLTEYGVNVIHDTSLNDYPSYNGSYTKTLGVIEDYLKKYPSIQIVIDIHRDSMTAADGTKYKVTTDIDGKKVAQMMIVCGTSQGGLSHPNWQENLKLALKFQSRLNSDYDKIARPLSIRKERFNTHATKGSMIIEVGTDANTLDEALLCASYASKSIAAVINELTV